MRGTATNVRQLLRLMAVGALLTCQSCTNKSKVTVHQPGSKSKPVSKPGFERGRQPPKMVVDSHLTLAQAVAGTRAPRGWTQRLAIVTVTYLGFDKLRHQGQLVVDKRLASEIKSIFLEIEQARYPVQRIVPVVLYGWDDQTSVGCNNTSSFNYRHKIIPGQKSQRLSVHAYGRAIDLNPFYNPYVASDGTSDLPYDKKHPAALVAASAPVRIFARHGWSWGGNWSGAKDYQHFEKVLPPVTSGD